MQQFYAGEDDGCVTDSQDFKSEDAEQDFDDNNLGLAPHQMILLESTLNNDEEMKLNNFSDTEDDLLSKLEQNLNK
jgi:hypothetical protein